MQYNTNSNIFCKYYLKASNKAWHDILVIKCYVDFRDCYISYYVSFYISFTVIFIFKLNSILHDVYPWEMMFC